MTCFLALLTQLQRDDKCNRFQDQLKPVGTSCLCKCCHVFSDCFQMFSDNILTFCSSIFPHNCVFHVITVCNLYILISVHVSLIAMQWPPPVVLVVVHTGPNQTVHQPQLLLCLKVIVTYMLLAMFHMYSHFTLCIFAFKSVHMYRLVQIGQLLSPSCCCV